MKVSADSFAARVAAAARPVRPWLHISTSRRVARFLVAAGARPGPELLRIEDLEVAEHRRSAHVDQTIDYLAADYLAELNQRRLDLRGKDLSGKDLSGADLYGRDLRGVVMRDANLTGANLGNANLKGADLAFANLTTARLAGANLGNADLNSADLNRADLRRARLRGALLGGARLGGADLTGADLTGAHLSDADLTAVLWSDTTQWSTGVAEDLRARSDEVQPGVWRVAGSGSANADVDTPLVPVRLPTASHWPLLAASPDHPGRSGCTPRRCPDPRARRSVCRLVRRPAACGRGRSRA